MQLLLKTQAYKKHTLALRMLLDFKFIYSVTRNNIKRHSTPLIACSPSLCVSLQWNHKDKYDLQS